MFSTWFNWLADTDSLTAISTAVIAAFTIILTIVGAIQSWFIRQTIGLARAEFISTHRPKIILRDAHQIAQSVAYLLVNVGATRATIVESWILVEFVERNTRLRPIRSAGHDDLGRLVFAGGESRDLTCDLPNGISFAMRFPDTRRIGIEGKPPIFGTTYFVGALIYEDDLGVRRRSIFRRRWDEKSMTFVRLEPDQERDHEYSD